MMPSPQSLSMLLGGYLPYTRPNGQGFPSFMTQPAPMGLPPMLGGGARTAVTTQPVWPIATGRSVGMPTMGMAGVGGQPIDALLAQRRVGGWMGNNLPLGLGWLGRQGAAGAQQQLNTRAQASMAQRYGGMGQSGNVWRGTAPSSVNDAARQQMASMRGAAPSGYTDSHRGMTSKAGGDKGSGSKRK